MVGLLVGSGLWLWKSGGSGKKNDGTLNLPSHRAEEPPPTPPSLEVAPIETRSRAPFEKVAEEARPSQALQALAGINADLSLTGSVQDREGEAVVGASLEVHLTWNGGEALGMPEMLLATGSTDSEGGFRLSGFLVPGERSILSVFHPDFARVSVTIDPLVPSTLHQRIVLLPGAPISGRVVNESNQGIPGAMIELLEVGRFVGASGFSVGKVQAGEDGAFLLEHTRPGLYSLTARAEGYAPGTILEVRVIGSNRIDGVNFQLKTATELVARVLHKDDETPVADIAVTARPIGGQGLVARSPTQWARARTDGAGLVRFRGVAPGTYVVTCPDLPREAVVPVNATTGAISRNPEEWPTVRVGSQGLLSGRVTDSATGAALKRFQLCLRPILKKNRRVTEAWQSLQSEDGTFALPLKVTRPKPGSPAFMAPTRWQLLATAPGYGTAQSRPFALDGSPGNRQVDLQLVRGVPVFGRIENEGGDPISQAQVRLLEVVEPGERVNLQGTRYREFRRSVEDGSYVFPGVGDGRYVIQVVHPEFAPLRSEDFWVDGGTGLEISTLVLKPDAGIRGVVLNQDGMPDAHALVSIVSETPGEALPQTVSTDWEGRFYCSRLTHGVYLVRVIRRAGVPVPEKAEPPVPVEVKPGVFKELLLKEPRR